MMLTLIALIDFFDVPRASICFVFKQSELDTIYRIEFQLCHTQKVWTDFFARRYAHETLPLKSLQRNMQGIPKKLFLLFYLRIWQISALYLIKNWDAIYVSQLESGLTLEMYSREPNWNKNQAINNQ